jgi:hypothetical protein
MRSRCGLFWFEEGLLSYVPPYRYEDVLARSTGYEDVLDRPIRYVHQVQYLPYILATAVCSMIPKAIPVSKNPFIIGVLL